MNYLKICGFLWWSSCVLAACGKKTGFRTQSIVKQVASEVGSADQAKEKTDGSDSPSQGEERKDSLGVFETTVYPVLRDRCVGCHESEVRPFFAVASSQDAHDTIVDQGKVDFADTERSRLYLRLYEENHNCWSECGDDAEEMLTALNSWADVNSAEPEVIPNMTAMVAFKDGSDPSPRADPTTIVQIAADSADVTAPMVAMDDDPDGDVAEYLVVPTGNGGRILPEAVVGQAGYTFDVKVAGTYYLWLRVNAPNGNADSFHIDFNGSGFFRYNTGVTNGDWAWSRVNNNNAELSFDLPVGQHALLVGHREEETRFNTVALTMVAEDFEGSAAAPEEEKELRIDLSGLTGKNATLVFRAREFDAESKTILISDLQIETDTAILIKEVNPLINGKLNSQHSNYKQVDLNIAAPGGQLSSAPMVLIGEQGFALDQIAFSFGVVE